LCPSIFFIGTNFLGKCDVARDSRRHCSFSFMYKKTEATLANTRKDVGKGIH
jgi:hypothetical protein